MKSWDTIVSQVTQPAAESNEAENEKIVLHYNTIYSNERATKVFN